MPAEGAILHGFAYGEHLEGPQQRSLGYRLLAPLHPAPWAAEVESLARRLQAAPYPDHWPPTDLFCSVLLADGQRLIAVARYGLSDNTPSKRRGGLELVGVVGPGSLGVPSALAIYHWLRQRRAATEDLRSLGTRHALADVLSAMPPMPPPSDPVPVLPIRMWQEGALLFAATTPSDPDHRLGLLEQGAAGPWQWLPLVGADFPLPSYARRGPLVAWTPHLADVAVKVDQPTAEGSTRPFGGFGFPAVIGLLLAGLLAGNLWAMLSLPRRVAAVVPPPSSAAAPAPVVEKAANPSGDPFPQALYRLLQKESGLRDWNQASLLAQYERVVAADPGLRQTSAEGQAAVGAVSVLAHRSAVQVEAMVRDALSGKGYDAELVNLACRQVHQRLAEAKDGP